MRRCVFAVVHRRTSLVIISDAASPAPKRRAITRNGRSVTPAMGASTTLEGSVYGPMRAMPGGALSIDMASAGGAGPGAGVGRAADRAVLRAQAGVDHEAHRGLAGVEHVHLGVHALVGFQQSL